MSLAGLLLVLLLGPAQADDPGAVAREILAGGGQQSELPEGSGAAQASRGGPTERADAPDREPESAPSRDDASSAWRLPPALVQFFLNGLLWAAIVFVGIVLVLLIVGRVRDGPAPARSVESTPTATTRARGPISEEALEDPEGLAAAGRYGDAIHVLLLRALRGLPRASFAPGATAREIVAAAALDARRRAALSGLVQAVERCLFAALVPVREDYETCVRLASVLGPGGSPDVRR